MAPRKTQTTSKTSRTSVRKTSEVKEESAVASPVLSEEVSRRVNRNRRFTYIIAFVLAIAGILYLSRNYFIAATVNGQMITKLTLYQELEKQHGKQVLDTIITKVLVEQEAKKRNLSVTPADIDAELKKIEDRFTSQGQKLDDVLKSQGYSKEELKDQVRLQLLVEKMVADKIQITDEEVTKYLTDNKSFLPKDKKEEDLKADARENLRQEKLNQEIQTLMQELRTKANIQPASLNQTAAPQTP